MPIEVKTGLKIHVRFVIQETWETDGTAATQALVSTISMQKANGRLTSYSMCMFTQETASEEVLDLPQGIPTKPLSKYLCNKFLNMYHTFFFSSIC